MTDINVGYLVAYLDEDPHVPWVGISSSIKGHAAGWYIFKIDEKGRVARASSQCFETAEAALRLPAHSLFERADLP